MKKNIMAGLFLVMAGCAQAQPTAVAGNIEWLHEITAAKELAGAQNKPILIDFYTDWCGWCKRLDADTYANPDVGAMAKNFVCVKINAEKYPQLAKEYGVGGFPTTVFLKADGTLIEAVPGYMPPAVFLNLMKKMAMQRFH
jgi:uncharacterized protein YyaL (SSP411 family)